MPQTEYGPAVLQYCANLKFAKICRQAPLASTRSSYRLAGREGSNISALADRCKPYAFVKYQCAFCASENSALLFLKEGGFLGEPLLKRTY